MFHLKKNQTGQLKRPTYKQLPAFIRSQLLSQIYPFKYIPELSVGLAWRYRPVVDTLA
jgi:hypothetical protein